MTAVIVLGATLAAIALLFIGAAIQGYIRREHLWREPQWFDKDDSFWLGEDWQDKP